MIQPPWESEAAFSVEHRTATLAEKGGDSTLMDALTARLHALEGAGKAFYPGSFKGVSFGAIRQSEPLTDAPKRDQIARTPVRFEERLCGCKVFFNAAGVPVIVEPECGPLKRCTDIQWRNKHVLEQVELERNGHPVWR